MSKDTIEPLKKELEKLSKRIFNLEEYSYFDGKLKELRKEEPKKGYWKPEVGECYWIVTDCGGVFECIQDNSFEDRFRIAQGNCFKTEEQAEKHLEYLWEL